MKCSSCGTEIEGGTAQCPNCGADGDFGTTICRRNIPASPRSSPALAQIVRFCHTGRTYGTAGARR
ncbi:MAG: zinc-ribbon domain-containing protein [Treponemataceae bacterium]|nr:zinc-ribbon domain-containing protein [Treponemataceae bacterium]